MPVVACWMSSPCTWVGVPPALCGIAAGAGYAGRRTRGGQGSLCPSDPWADGSSPAVVTLSAAVAICYLLLAAVTGLSCIDSSATGNRPLSSQLFPCLFANL